ncbi:histidinol-phosphate aminotransferase [Piedraia hortae CBS 480.64]|uniref:histidinol-phosphate transaminase n=1 Tax=Piedraia hortae CBS 480.64 TaxID=1314780 RepID=A0A6A7C9N7_9PEZI|nr:histidinol-phosphate aminotransferase [Piedraia hortae CBS 480.64]
MAFNLSTCARPNILSLTPYRCARDDYKEAPGQILLDANENTHGHSLSPSEGPLNRYPDPHQNELKQAICALRNENPTNPLTEENLFLGVGSDELIDALMRAFCVPGKDKIITTPPTYGMYSVAAKINDVEVLTIPLEGDDFSLQTEKIISTITNPPPSESEKGRVKLVFLCSPGNPTGVCIPPSSIKTLLSTPFNGLIIIDEAYIDFSTSTPSLAPLVPSYPNLIVLQTLSKAFGLAGIRMGIGFAPKNIAAMLNGLKAPYNVSSLASRAAIKALQPAALENMRRNRDDILQQKGVLMDVLPGIKGVGRIRGGKDANFVLFEVCDKQGRSNEFAKRVYATLAQRGVVIRFRGEEYGCEGCLRATVGTEEENKWLVKELRDVLEG